MARAVLIASLPTQVISTGQRFLLGSAFLYPLPAANVAWRTAVARVPGHFCFLGGYTVSHPADGLGLFFEKNGTPGSGVTLVEGWNETADSDTVIDGDLWSIGATTGGDDLSTARIVFSADTGHATYNVGIGPTAPGTGTANYHPLVGSAVAYNPRTQAEIQFNVAGTIGNLQVYVSANNINASSAATVVVNGVDTALTLTIGALATGLFESTSGLGVHVDPDDLVCLKFHAGTDPGKNIFLEFHDTTFTADSGASADIFGTTGLAASNFTGTRYIPIAGDALVGSTNANLAKCRIGFPATLSKMWCHAYGNARTTDTVWRLYVNGVAGSSTFTIPALTTGYFQAVLSDIVAAADDVYIAVESGADAGHNLDVTSYGMVVTDNGGGTACNHATVPPDVGTPTVGTDDDVAYTPRTYITKVRQLKPYPRLPINEYEVGEGGKSKFPVSFRVMSQTDLRVTVDDVELDQSDFTLDGELLSDGTAVTDGVVRIWSDPAPKRETDLVAAGIAMVGVNDAMQTLWVCDIAQQLRLKRQTVLAFAAAHTFTVAESGGLFKSVTGTLPPASPGLHYDLNGGSATRAGSDTIYDGSASGTILTAGSSDAYARLISPKAGLWFVAKKTGTWSLA